MSLILNDDFVVSLWYLSGVKWLKKGFSCTVQHLFYYAVVTLIPPLHIVSYMIYSDCIIFCIFHSLFQVATEMVSIRRDNGKKKDKIIDLLERFNVELKQFDLKENDGQTAGNRRGSSAIESFLKLEGATKDLEIDFQEKIKRAKDDECLVVVSGMFPFFWLDICLPCSPGIHCFHPEKNKFEKSSSNLKIIHSNFRFLFSNSIPRIFVLLVAIIGTLGHVNRSACSLTNLYQG